MAAALYPFLILAGISNHFKPFRKFGYGRHLCFAVMMPYPDMTYFYSIFLQSKTVPSGKFLSSQSSL